MIRIPLIKEIQRRLPWVLNSFGGIEQFLAYLKNSLNIDQDTTYKNLTANEKLELYTAINILLNYTNDLISIAPWNLFIDLRQNFSSLTDNDSIDINTPYQVYTTKGNLIYTVKTHLGIFGESRLDKNLINISTNASMYFLKYNTYKGEEKIKLLLVNLYSKNSLVNNQNYQLLDNNSDSILTVINNTGQLLNIYKTDSPFLLIPNEELLRIPSNLYTIKNNEVINFNVNNSCYLLIDRPTIIEHTKVTYPSSNIVFIDNPQSPIFVASNIAPELLNREYNKTILFTNKPLNDILTIKPDLI